MALSKAPPLEAAAEKAEPEIRELIRQVRAGNLEAFEQILRRHEGRVLSLAIQMGLPPADAQDVCQEVFLRVFRYLGGFQADRKFEVWLWRIAVNAVYDALRKRRDRGEVSWDGVTSGPDDFSQVRRGGLQFRIENADLVSKLLSRLDRLSAQERMVFVLKQLQDLDTVQVARTLRISAVTVRRHYSTARQKLRTVMQELLGRGPSVRDPR